MSLFPATLAPPSEPAIAPVHSGPADSRLRWFELILVLLVAFSGSLIASVYYLRAGPPSSPQVSTYRWITSGVHQIVALLLLAYVLKRRSRTFRDLGLRWSVRDVAVGAGLALLAFFSYIAGAIVLRDIHMALFGSPGTGPTGRDFFLHPGFGGLLYNFINAPFEELIVRAYVMTEVSELTGSMLFAGLVSLAIQVSYHLYYGVQGALSVGFLFVVFALYYASKRRALPIISAHAVFDLFAIYRLW